MHTILCNILLCGTAAPREGGGNAVYIYIYIFIYVSMYACMDVCMHVCMHVCACMYAFMYVCMRIHYICMHIRIYKCWTGCWSIRIGSRAQNRSKTGPLLKKGVGVFVWPLNSNRVNKSSKQSTPGAQSRKLWLEL
jgi:hypothetical protein